jgi:hypothetical protein
MANCFQSLKGIATIVLWSISGYAWFGAFAEMFSVASRAAARSRSGHSKGLFIHEPNTGAIRLMEWVT